MFIVGAEPVHRNKGQECMFFLREDGKSHIRIIEVPESYRSKRLERSAAFRLAEQYREYSPVIMPSSKRYVLRIQGPRELRDYLKPDFESHTNQWLDLLYPPLSAVDVSGQKPRITGKMTAEELLKETACALDIEIQDWETDPKMFSVAYASDKGMLFLLSTSQKKNQNATDALQRLLYVRMKRSSFQALPNVSLGTTRFM